MGAEQSQNTSEGEDKESSAVQHSYRPRGPSNSRRNESGAAQPSYRPRHSSGSRTRYRPSTPQYEYNERIQYEVEDDDLKCPTCGSMFRGQIFQCNRGHSSCHDCKNSRQPCGICGNQIILRNNILEQHIGKTLVTCLYQNDGCNLVLQIMELETHMKECPFQKLKCPAGCYWKGKLRNLCGHFDDVHPELREIDTGTEVLLDDIKNDSQNVFLLLIGSFHFLFHLKVSKQDRRVYMTVQCITDQASAAEWYYDIHVYNKSECRRKYRFTDVCSSFAESVDSIFDESRCSVLPYNYATTFVNRDVLAFKIFINNIS